MSHSYKFKCVQVCVSTEIQVYIYAHKHTVLNNNHPRYSNYC